MRAHVANAFGLALAGMTAGAVTAGAETPTAPAGADRLDECVKAISVLGASMGQRKIEGEDGRPVYRFRVRTSGLDYVALCDAGSGIVRAVTPRLAPDEDAG